jgi:ABC-type cobalamin/Fe3+-siderophores transport system ATPase subunit
MAEWTIKSIEISGGFLAGLSLQLPGGLTCIIGPRGSGKSTLAEAVRYALLGSAGAAKQRMDLLQANLRGSIVTIQTAPDDKSNSYVVRRSFQQLPAVTSADGRVLTDIELDRGTFLPLDAYGTAEIESFADESLGEKRRLLLDELISGQLRDVQLKLNDCLRQLDSNADAIKAAERLIADLKERIEEIGDARGRLAALPPPPPGAEGGAIVQASEQQQRNLRESQALDRAIQSLADFRRDVQSMLSQYQSRLRMSCSVESSVNRPITDEAGQILARCETSVTSAFTGIERTIVTAEEDLRPVQSRLNEAHGAQKATFDGLQAKNAVAGQAVQLRTAAEQVVAKLASLERERDDAVGLLKSRNAERETLKASYLLDREKVSRLRSSIAGELLRNTGAKVRIRVLENADTLQYRQLLTDGLRGAGVRNHEDILSQLLCLRPEHLAQLVRDNDVEEFCAQSNLGRERSAKILEAYRTNIDTYALEVTAIDDQVKIELDVSPSGESHFKDASELSRGQKCTALLPLLLARRASPLVIDQPEDNLDNHFIYETVVESVHRMKLTRQMVFITHNANIPVLGEADLVVVMNSDGRRGFIEKTGTLDECRPEIIDLLEGGEEAFELRRKRYAK